MKGRIGRVEYVGALTGEKSANDTPAYSVGGCDLGFPCYDDAHKTLLLFFGDTFLKPNLEGRWRSNTVARVRDFDCSRGVRIGDFVAFPSGIARPAIEGHHRDKYEMTKIPTGAVAVNGAVYLFYFSKYTWWDVPPEHSMNYGGAVRSTDGGETWERVYDMTWADHADGERAEEIGKLINENAYFVQDCGNVSLAGHLGYDFTQIFPKDGGDGYIYLYGEGGYRTQGVKLARVRKEEIECFAKYEYYQGRRDGVPVWLAGRTGLDALAGNAESFLIREPCGELSVAYNPYLAKWLLFTVRPSGEESGCPVLYAADTPCGPFEKWDEPLLAAAADVLPEKQAVYAPMAHELWMEEGGRSMLLLLSVWVPVYNPAVLRLRFAPK